MEPVTQHRTQIYLPYGLYQKAKRLARDNEETLSGVIRRAVELLDEKTALRLARNDKETGFWEKLMKLKGVGKGPVDLAQKHDDYWDM